MNTGRADASNLFCFACQTLSEIILVLFSCLALGIGPKKLIFLKSFKIDSDYVFKNSYTTFSVFVYVGVTDIGVRENIY